MTGSVSSTTTASTSVSYSQNRNDFDTDALVEAAVSAKLTRADSLETRITGNEAKIAAYQEMQSLMLAMQDSLQALRADPSSAGMGDDVFLNRTAYLTSSTTTDPDTLLSVTVEDGTDLDAHSIEIQRVATAERLGGGTMSSRSDAAGLAGTFTLGTTLDGSASVAVTADMSLDDIVSAVNAQTAATGVKASVLQVSSGSYMMILTGTSTAAEIAVEDTDGTILESLGIIDSSGDKANVLQQPQTALLSIDGVTIERDGNEIDDAVDGIILTLYKAEPGNILTLEVDNSLSDIKGEIQTLVETYNALRDFVLANQDTSDDGTAGDEAVLFADSTLRTASNALQEALTAVVGGNSMALLGLSFDSSNHLDLDEDKLDDALLNDLDQVEALLTFQATTSSANLTLLRHGDGPASDSFTLEITTDGDGIITGVTKDGEAGFFTFDAASKRIIGVDGTDYEGMSFVFSGKSSQSIAVSVSQGLADRMWQAVETIADEYDGTLTQTVSDLEDANDDLADRVTAIQINAESYRAYLLDKYARIEAKLAEAQALLDLLEALNNVNSED
jgi:flagellar hook-associated protein 2